MITQYIKRTQFFYLGLLAWFVGHSPALLANTGPQQRPHIEVELVSEWQQWQPGTTNWLAVALRPESGWHTYWKNPGEAGLATSMDWQLPTGFSAGGITWPYPQRLAVGDIVDYGYKGEVLLMVPVALPEQLREAAYQATVNVSWLICEEICIPGEARLTLTLPTGTEASPVPSRFAELFTATRERLPVDGSASAVQLSVDSGELILTFPPDQTLDTAVTQQRRLALFAAEEGLLKPSANTRWQATNTGVVARHALSPFFTALPPQVELIVSVDGLHALRFVGSQALAATTSTAGETATAASPHSRSQRPLILLLAMALAGGLLLNLMPCVFPVLAIKAISLMKLSSAEKREARLHGWLYLAGVQASLLLLALLLLLLKQSGEALGWGFQLQEPWFLAVLAGLMFIMGLSLMGAFEIGGRWMSLGQNQISRGGHSAAFLSGCLAVVVASPCMTPLMAPALGAALNLPALPMVAVLMALGFGLAMPIWLVSLFPPLARLLPKPGRWLETFKQAMAFPLFITGIWLLWLLQNLQAELLIWTLSALLMLVFLIWLGQSGFKRTGQVLTITSLVGLIWLLLPGQQQEASLAARAENFDQRTLTRYREAGTPTLVNMTADWCLTCKLNERTTLADQEVAETFARLDIRYMVGDWTRRDPAISAYLDQYQHAGVPLYVLYDKHGVGKVLPQLLTPSMLIESLTASVDLDHISLVTETMP